MRGAMLLILALQDYPWDKLGDDALVVDVGGGVGKSALLIHPGLSVNTRISTD